MIEKFKSVFLPLRVKLIILFFVLIITPFLISGFVTFTRYSKSVEESTKVYSKELTDQININLDNYLSEINRLTILPLYESSIINILKKYATEKREKDFIPSMEITTMNLFLSSIDFNRSEFRGIFIMAVDGTLFSSLDDANYRNFSRNNEWLRMAEVQGQKMLLIAPHNPKYYYNSEKEVFSIVRAIRNPYDGKFLGLIKIDLTHKVFDKAIATSNYSKGNKLYVTDKTGNVYYSGEEKIHKFNIPQTDKINIDHSTFIVSNSTSNITGLNVIGLVDEGEFRKDAIQLTNSSLIISVVSLFFAILMAIFFSDRIVNPVRHLQKMMRKVQGGDFEVRATVFSRDEIGTLSQGFNVMVSEINNLMKEVYETKLRQRDAELSALQSQINPHFLYNTLELVNMIALENNQFEISDIVSSLGRLFRYTVDKKEKPVLLKEEIRFIKAYLKIISSRCGSKLKTELSIDPYLEYCLVPKLIIQPLVENAFQHGINEGEGKIAIRAEKDDEYLILSVEDNGVGINNELLMELEEKIYGEESHNEYLDTLDNVKKGYALRNVHQRIRIIYGDNYGLTIDNRLQKGCKFILKLPIIFSNTRDMKF